MADIHGMNLQTLDLNLLLVFEALLEERNVTRAAKRIGLSQPAMSNALARLRRTFDDVLFVRSAEGMVPTPAALRLSGPVRSSLAQLRSALDEKSVFDPAASQRAFQLLASDYAEIVLLPRLLRSLRRAAPRVALRVHRPRSLFEAPDPADLADSADLAVGFFPDPLGLDPSIRSEVLWEEKNVCIAATSHPSIRGALSLRQYAEAGHVAVFYKAAGPGVIDTLLAQKGLARRAAVTVPHFASVPFLVSASDLIATVPEGLAGAFRGSLKLQVLPAPIAIPPFRLTMLWHERLSAEPAQEWLRDFVSETARGASGTGRHRKAGN